MQTKEPNIAFFGTPRFAVFVLDALQKHGLTPSLVVTVPDKPAGRGLEMKSSPVKEWALQNTVRVIQPEKLDDWNEEETFDLFIVAGYGKLLPHALLSMPKHGTLNVHPSLLPKYRGTSPVESQILADEKNIGVSVIVLDAEMDHGPILAQKKINPEPWPMRRNALEDLLWHEGARLLAASIPAYLGGTMHSIEQNHAQATVTPKLKKEDGLLDLNSNGYQNYLKFCAYQGWPGIYFFLNGMRIKIADAKYENGAFTPLRVIPEGKREIDYNDFLRDAP